MTQQVSFAVGTVDGEWYFTDKREAYEAAQKIAADMKTHAEVYRHHGDDVQLAAEFEADGDYTLHMWLSRL